MSWKRMGRIFNPADHDWAGTHAQVPAALLYDDKVRVYYADRFADGRSFTTYVDLDRNDLSKILYCHKKPILDFGAPGMFDDDGIMPGFALRRNGQVWLYYNGWNRGMSVPYRNSVGIAVSDDDGATFRRMFEGPVLDRTATEPLMAVTPTLMIEGDLWRIWYTSGTRWVLVNGKYEPVYLVKYGTSRDGVRWDRPNHLCISPKHENEAISHATVIKHGDQYLMWFCCRDSVDYRDGRGSYRIGYAESPDGVEWTRLDEVNGLDVSGEGWDSSMTSYPFVLKIDQKIIMIYNGNGFGQTGFGYAILEQSK